MKNCKKVIALLLMVVFCLSCSTVAFAAEQETDAAFLEENISDASVQPRVGIAGYKNYHHKSGSYYGSFTISTSSITLPMKQYTVQLGEFNSDTWVLIDIYNSRGQHMQSMTFGKQGNGKWENQMMNSLYFTNGDTYTIKYNVYDTNSQPLFTDDGWIGIWIY